MAGQQHDGRLQIARPLDLILSSHGEKGDSVSQMGRGIPAIPRGALP